jgi:ATP adenylyltransferase (5'',5''''''-P-1,P-4-tetraphosphate phosphorylase II)
MKRIVTSSQVAELLQEQLNVWELARDNYEALKQVKVKELVLDNLKIKVQFNPARIASSSAKVDTKSIQERKCFLCEQNRPAIQKGIPFGDDYKILINPFPIFPKHLTIPSCKHVDQRIAGRLGDMLDLAYNIDEYTIFYNGPKCGASAPDHVHFQAGNKGFLPIEKEWRQFAIKPVLEFQLAKLYILHNYLRGTFVIESESKENAVELFEQIYALLEVKPGEDEPMMNVLAWYDEGKWIVCVFPRSLHRPSCYTAEGEDNILISPGSVDMGGVFIIPMEKDFDKITAENAHTILTEVCMDEVALKKIAEHIKPAL